MTGITKARPILSDRAGWWRALAVIVIVSGAVLLLWLGRDGTFFHDELWYVCGRTLGDIATWFAPHNEHWVTLHVVAYLLAAGQGSHVPVQVLLVATHAIAAGGLFVLVRRWVGPVPGLAATAVLMVFGWGWLNLYWGFQSGFIGAIALGLWALAILPDHPRLASGLLLLGVMTAGSVLPFVPAAAVLLANRRSVVWLLIPVIAFLAYRFVTDVATRGTFIPEAAPAYVLAGVIATAGAVAGTGPLMAALASVAAILTRPKPGRLAAAGVAGLLATFGILAVARQGFSSVDAPHYLYAGAPFALMIAADVFGHATRRAWIALPFVAAAVLGNLALTVAHGLEWPAWQAAQIAAGANLIPADMCRVVSP